MIAKDKIQTCIQEFKKKPTLLIDDISPCPSCYLTFPAEEITDSIVSFLVNNARGIIFAAISSAKAKQLGLSYLAPNGSSILDSMTVSVESRYGVSTGISSADRAKTLQVLALSKDAKQDIVTPGHIFPLVAKTGGVLVKNTATELAIDLCLLSAHTPVCALAQCLDQSGKILTVEGGIQFAEDMNLNHLSISEMVNYRLAKENIVNLVEKQMLKDNIELHKFKSVLEGGESHFALTINSESFTRKDSVLVRVQSEDIMKDIFNIDNGIQINKINKSLELIKTENCGAFIYIRHPKRSKNEMMSQLRELGLGAQLIKSLGIKKIRLLGASDRIINGISAFGIDIEKRISI